MTVNRIASTQMQDYMVRLSTARRINSAADDAAGLGISENLHAQIRGLEQGTRNVLDMQSLVNTAEGGLSSINENLQRIRELTLQAGNPIYTAEDRMRLQDEVDQLMEEINRAADTTEFNTMSLLDGSFVNQHTAADARGQGPSVTIGNMHADMIMGHGQPPIDLVDGDMNQTLQRVDNALSRVTRERSYLGAMSNRFDYTVASNQITNLNMAAARSRIADQDMALATMRLSQENVLLQYQLMAQRERQDREETQNPLIALMR